jgi:YgiT-type zinc finger domain-containing protein
MCKGKLEDKNTTFLIDVGNCIIIVKNVPSQVCSQCGEVSYSDCISEKLETIVDDLRKAATEIAVVNYSDEVA